MWMTKLTCSRLKVVYNYQGISIIYQNIMLLNEMINFLGKPYFQTENCLIYQQDCLEAMPKLPENYIAVLFELGQKNLRFLGMGNGELGMGNIFGCGTKYLFIAFLKLIKNGKIKVNPLGKNPTDVWNFPKVTSGKNRASKERTSHPAQFPVAVIERIIKAASNPNEIVFDPFMGSGTTAVAALGLNRQVIGLEIREDYCEIAASRIEDLINN